MSEQEELLRWFRYDHLPFHLQATSMRFSALAKYVVEVGDGREVIASLRALLEAKDCAVRAALFAASVAKDSAQAGEGDAAPEEKQG